MTRRGCSVYSDWPTVGQHRGGSIAAAAWAHDAAIVRFQTPCHRVYGRSHSLDKLVYRAKRLAGKKVLPLSQTVFLLPKTQFRVPRCSVFVTPFIRFSVLDHSGMRLAVFLVLFCLFTSTLTRFPQRRPLHYEDKRLAGTIISEMIYFVSSGPSNFNVPGHEIGWE